MGFVYLIEAIDNGTFKIGVTKNDPIKRLKQLATGSDSELVIIGTYKTENHLKVEKWLHRKYSDIRINGEWFALTQENINDFIHTCNEADKAIKILLKENPFYN